MYQDILSRRENPDHLHARQEGRAMQAGAESFTNPPSSFEPSSRRRVAVLYETAAGDVVYDVATEIAARAWDAGATVRVRRFGGPAPHGDARAEEDDVPVVAREDVEWASVTLVLARALDRRTAPTTFLAETG